MTKKHFEAAAAQVRAIGGAKPSRRDLEDKQTVAWAFVHLFTEFNPRFDRERFLTACGLP